MLYIAFPLSFMHLRQKKICWGRMGNCCELALSLNLTAKSGCGGRIMEWGWERRGGTQISQKQPSLYSRRWWIDMLPAVLRGQHHYTILLPYRERT